MQMPLYPPRYPYSISAMVKACQGLGKSPILEDGHQSMRNGITYETSDDVCIPIPGLMIIPDIVICAMVKNNCIPILGDGPEWS